MDYEQLRQKYQLPELHILDYEFELDEEEKYLLREIRRKMTEKLMAYVEILEGILQPDTSSIEQMHEMSFFSEKQKNDVQELYKIIMKLIRFSNQAGVVLDEQVEAEFIKSVFSQWKIIKEQMGEILNKLKECWDKDSVNEEDLRYLG